MRSKIVALLHPPLRTVSRHDKFKRAKQFRNAACLIFSGTRHEGVPFQPVCPVTGN